jgi:TolB protein
MRRKLILLGGVILLLSILTLLHRPGAEQAFRLYQVAVDSSGGGDATLSPDGTRFVATSRRAGSWNLWMYDLGNSHWTRLTDHPADDFEGRWSPDGTQLAFCSSRAGQKNIWLLTLANGDVRQLTFGRWDEEYPVWSPDGQLVAFTGGPWGARDFFVVPVRGGEPRKVTRNPGLAGACAFDPSGHSLVCHRYDAGTGHLSRLWLDDGTTTPLTAGSAWDYKPCPSPDGHWIAFSRSDEGPAQLCLLPSVGGKVRRLTASPHDDRWPTWSAAGDRLLFHRIVNEGTAVKLLDRTTGQITTLVGPEERPLQASLHAQGRHLAYCSQTNEGKVLKVLDLTTGTARLLDTGPGEASFPRWSPDGKQITFIAKPGPRWEVGVVCSDGRGRVLLTEATRELHGMEGPVDWSPDGTKLLFKADTLPFEALLYTVDTRTRRVEPVTTGHWFDEAPSWTPDGKGILFMSTRGGDWTWGIFRLSLGDGTLEAMVKPDRIEKNFPRTTENGALIWSAFDEQNIEFLAEQERGGKVRLLTEAGPGARWPSYSADGSRILFTTVHRKVEYWVVENLNGPGSPLREPTTVELLGSSPSFTSRPAPTCRPWRTPSDLHRR